MGRFAWRFRGNQRVFAAWRVVSNGKKATAIMPKGSELFLVDSSGWIEFLGDGPLADRFAPYFDSEERLIVPAIVLSEVYNKLLSAHRSPPPDRFLSTTLLAPVMP